MYNKSKSQVPRRRTSVVRSRTKTAKKRNTRRPDIPKAVVTRSSKPVLMSFFYEGREVVASPNFVKQTYANSVVNPFLVAPQPVVVGITAVNDIYNYARVVMFVTQVKLINNSATDPVQVSLIETVSDPGALAPAYPEIARGGDGMTVLLAKAGGAGSASACILRRKVSVRRLVGTLLPVVSDSYVNFIGAGGSPTQPADFVYASWCLISQGAALDVSWEQTTSMG